MLQDAQRPYKAFYKALPVISNAGRHLLQQPQPVPQPRPQQPGPGARLFWRPCLYYTGHSLLSLPQIP